MKNILNEINFKKGNELHNRYNVPEMKISELGDLAEEHIICVQNIQKAKMMENISVRRHRRENKREKFDMGLIQFYKEKNGGKTIFKEITRNFQLPVKMS